MIYIASPLMGRSFILVRSKSVTEEAQPAKRTMLLSVLFSPGLVGCLDMKVEARYHVVEDTPLKC